jgi:hypothetical protein
VWVGKRVPNLCNELLIQCGWERGFLICVINSSYSVGGKEGSYFVYSTPLTVWVGKRVPTLCNELLLQHGWERGFLLCVINSSYSVGGKGTLFPTHTVRGVDYTK